MTFAFARRGGRNLRCGGWGEDEDDGRRYPVWEGGVGRVAGSEGRGQASKHAERKASKWGEYITNMEAWGRSECRQGSTNWAGKLGW